MDPKTTLIFAESSADYDAFGEMCRAYVVWLHQRYSDMPGFVDAVFGAQDFEDELSALSVMYGPPAGRTLLAIMANRVVGGVAFRGLSADACEMKRLYVSDAARGSGLARALCRALISAAREEGYAVMRLDTADRLTEALALYASLGFQRIAPYQNYPAGLMRHLVFMEKALKPPASKTCSA